MSIKIVFMPYKRTRIHDFTVLRTTNIACYNLCHLQLRDKLIMMKSDVIITKYTIFYLGLCNFQKLHKRMNQIDISNVH